MKEGFNDSIAGNDYQRKSCIMVEFCQATITGRSHYLIWQCLKSEVLAFKSKTW